MNQTKASQVFKKSDLKTRFFTFSTLFLSKSDAQEHYCKTFVICGNTPIENNSSFLILQKWYQNVV